MLNICQSAPEITMFGYANINLQMIPTVSNRLSLKTGDII